MIWYLLLWVQLKQKENMRTKEIVSQLLPITYTFGCNSAYILDHYSF